MLRKRKYYVRHKILGVLQDNLSRFDAQEHVNIQDIKLTLQELVTASHLNEEEIIQEMNYLNGIEEIEWIWQSGVQSFIILRKGTISYFDRHLLYEGRKEVLNDINDYLKNIATTILLAIAGCTFIFNLIDTRQNQKNIYKMESELRQLKDTVQMLKQKK
ncbi:MAG: hypothetical protein JWQ40_5076 [Segetibacter sp.]|nr:hypothetical protein [Segetibacter sp.]